MARAKREEFPYFPARAMEMPAWDASDEEIILHCDFLRSRVRGYCPIVKCFLDTTFFPWAPHDAAEVNYMGVGSQRLKPDVRRFILDAPKTFTTKDTPL